MKTIILIATLFFFISCKMENTQLEKQDELKFFTEKIIIEDLSETSGNLIYHFLIKIENPTEREISLPVIDLQNRHKKKIETMFHLELNDKIYSTVSYLKGNEILALNSKGTGYILLSLSDKIDRNDLELGFINYAGKTKFRIVEINTTKIITDHKINIEEAIMLVHGKINGKQY